MRGGGRANLMRSCSCFIKGNGEARLAFVSTSFDYDCVKSRIFAIFQDTRLLPAFNSRHSPLLSVSDVGLAVLENAREARVIARAERASDASQHRAPYITQAPRTQATSSIESLPWFYFTTVL